MESGALVLVALGLLYLFVTKVLPKLIDWWAERAAAAAPARRRRPSQRERRVQLAAAEAADEDPAYAADEIVASAGRLFSEIQLAWDAGDRGRLATLAGPDLMVEWNRRLDDFDRRGWRNHVQLLADPSVQLVGLTRKGDPDTDNVVVRIDARMKDYVVDRRGRHLKRTGRLGETTRIREFWTLQRPHGHWILASIEQSAEGKHRSTSRSSRPHGPTSAGCATRPWSRGRSPTRSPPTPRSPRSPTSSTTATRMPPRWT